VGFAGSKLKLKSSSLDQLIYAPVVRSSYKRLKAQEDKGSKSSGWKEAYLSLTEEEDMYVLKLYNAPNTYNTEANFPAAFAYEDSKDISSYLEQVGVPSDVPFC
jgi:hypothetical protein